MSNSHNDLRPPLTQVEIDTRTRNVQQSYKIGVIALLVIAIAIVLGTLATGTMLLVVFQVIAFLATIVLAACAAVYTYNTAQ